MFGNCFVSPSSLVRKVVLAVVIGVTFTFVGAVGVYAYVASPKSYSGTVGGVSWSAYDTISIAPGNGGTVYTGNSRTSAAQPLTLVVATSGREFCGPIQVDTDWVVNHTGVNSTNVAIGPVSGWAQAGQCWIVKTVVSNYTYHQAVNGSQSAEKTLDAWAQLPF